MSRIADVLRKIHESGDPQANELPGGTDPLALKRPEDIAVPWRLATDGGERRPAAKPERPETAASTPSVFVDLRRPPEYEPPAAASQPAAPASWAPRTSAAAPTQPLILGFDREIAALVESLFGNGSAVSSQSAPRRIVFGYLAGAPVPASLAIHVASRLAACRGNRSVGLLDLDCSGQHALSAELRVAAGAGFADVALDHAAVDSVAHPVPPSRNLRFIGPGSTAGERKAQLLASKQPNAGQRAVNAFDYVVAVAAAVDLPQASALLEWFDGVALVVDPRLATTEIVKTTAAQLTRSDIRVLGAIVDTRGAGRTSRNGPEQPQTGATSLKYVPAPFR